ncbi:hypothetical protein C9994_07300 [Marivirga lumbricoides]|uniref:TonB-dependent receptor n=1 Tax=Marivirga lumbricoides TaxID=1046115 RepID=A0A2T4DRJ6_9BACT|nr:hypothetical protein C9994_07300 [Marivirga lumbricoides]
MCNAVLAERGHAQNVKDVIITVEAKYANLAQLFKTIEGSTPFKFMYSSQNISLEGEIELENRKASVAEVLYEVSGKTKLQFRQINNSIVVTPGKNVGSKVKSARETWGIVTGKVIDAKSSEPLPGASVVVVGETYGAVTDLQGEFNLMLKTQAKQIEIRYLGYQTKLVDIEIPESDILIIGEIAMQANSVALSEVVTYGNLEGQQKALNQQKNSDNIKNIVAADQISRFPDPNVAEALQRVPGVNIERDQGEGRYVLVRGLAPQFTNININGEQIPSPEAGVRFVALDAIPADQLASIEVTKALTPDMDGDAIGGSVNLITRTAKSTTPAISGTLIGGYNNLMEKANGQGSLQYGQRFGAEGKLGLLVNASHYYTDRGSDNWERDGSEFELRDYALQRSRTGLSGTLDYNINANNNLYFRGIYNNFQDREQRRTYLFVPNEDDSPFEDAEIERGSKDRWEKQIVSSFNLGGKHSFANLSLDYEVSYSEAYQDTPFDTEPIFKAKADLMGIDFSTIPEFPRFTVEGVDYLDNSIYEFDEITTGNTYALDVNKTAKINLGIPYKLNGAEGLLKFGGKVRLKEKSFDITENVYSWEGGDIQINGASEDFTLNFFEGGLLDNNFLDGQYQINRNIDVSQLNRFFNQNRNGFALEVEDKQVAESVESYKATEDVYAAYLMTKLQFKKLMALGGFRYETTKVTYNSQAAIFDVEGDLDRIDPIDGGVTYDFLLPQIHFKYQLNPLTNIRFAATASYSRPNFEDIVPSQEIELNAREGSIGNPELAPVSAYNIDLMGEHYFGTVGIISAGLFYKNLDNFIFTQRYDSIINNINVVLNQSRNGESAELLGFELAYQQNMTFLPGALKGIGLYANYTYTNSLANISNRSGEAGTEEIRLPGQAAHVGNLSLAYDYGKFNLRASANFNGEYISELGDEADEDVYVKSRMQIDLTGAYRITRNFQVFGEFMNLTNQPYEVYQGSEDQYIQREFYSWWSRVGVKFNF